MLIHIVVVDPGNAEGNPSSHARPVKAYLDLDAAERYAAYIQQRPDEVSFWIPPASVEVVSMEVYRTWKGKA